MRQIAVVMVLWATSLAWPVVDQARANDVCTAGCTGDLRVCVHDGGANKLACRAECKSAGGHVGSCVRACRVAFRDERAACRAVARTCAADCLPADDPGGGDGGEPGTPPDPACPGRCGQALGRCLHDAAGGMPDCLHGCPQGRERHSCVGECQTNARDGGSQCREEHQQCLAGCGGVTSTTTTTSTITTETTATSTTTSTSIPPPVACGDAEAPTCDGSCPDVSMVCAETQPGVCGCVGGSAGAAFTGRHHGRR